MKKQSNDPLSRLCRIVAFWILTCSCCGFVLASPPKPSDDVEKNKAAGFKKTIVLAEPTDPYYSLARNIARQESLVLVHEMADAVEQDPMFILWVVHPGHLSENRMIEMGETLQTQGLTISVGIITGTTMAAAETLWQAELSRTRTLTTISEPRGAIFNHSPPQTMNRITVQNIQHVLQNSNYVAFSGGGGPGFWRIDTQKTYFKQQHIPELSSIIISSGGCQTAQIWKENSIALKFIDQGAVGYAGFIFSPAPYNLFGFPDKFPFQLSWRHFPIGLIVSLQNKGLFQGFARFPFFYLLGDPRLYFNKEAPYRLISDRMQNGIRHLEYQLDQPGIIPIKITDGAPYDFVRIKGITSVTEHDPFYNNFVQTMAIEKDRYILLNTDQTKVSLSLYPYKPWYWPITDPLLDSLDHVLFYIPQTTGLVYDAVVISLVLMITGWFCYQFQISLKRYIYASVLAASGFTLLYALYAHFRIDRMSIVNLPLHFNVITLIVTFVLTGCGTLIFLNAKGWKAMTSSILIATFPSWAVALFWLSGLTIVSLAALSKGLQSPIYNYNLGLMPLISSIILIALAFCLMMLLKKTIQKKDAG